MREYNKRPEANIKKRLRDKQYYHSLTTEQKIIRKEQSRDRVNKWNYRNRHKFKNYMHQYCKKYYQEHKQELKQRSILSHSKNRNKILQQNQIKHQLVKNVTIEYYSSGTMKCVRCGFSNMDALSIDHINNGGRKHIRDNHINGFYRWLLNNGFPEGYQVLCMSCQTKKAKEYAKAKLKLTGTISQLRKREQNRTYTLRKKITTISYYSQKTMKCNHCGCLDIDMLSIDHIHGGGLKHRKITGNSLTKWLYQKSFPEGFQVLCMNCQFIKEAEKRKIKRTIYNNCSTSQL